MKAKRIVWIDALRSICVLYIAAFWHLDDYMSSDIQNLTVNDFTCQLTYSVLATFTLLSGFFCIKNKISSLKDIMLYYKKKILRTYPLFLVASLLFLLCGYISLDTLIVLLLGLGEFKAPFASTLWFMSMIFVFYFVTPFIMKIQNKVFQFIFCIILEIIFYIGNYTFSIDIRLVYYWPFFCFGMYINYKKWYLKLDRIKSLLPVLIGVYLFGASKVGKNFGIFTYLCATLFIISISTSLFIFLEKKKQNKIIDVISYSSMCLYLFHRPFYYLISISGGIFSVVKAYCIYFPIVLLVCYFIQHIYDRMISLIGSD